MKIAQKKIINKILLLILLFSPFLFIIFVNITKAPIKSDATLNLYIAQQLAVGAKPYANYFIMHPPLSHFITAVIIFFAKIFSIDSILISRIFSLVLSCLIIWITYKYSKEISGNQNQIIIWILQYNFFALMVVWGFYEKLIMVLFLYLSLYLLQKEKYIISGVFFGLVLMTWGGSVVFLPIYFLIFVLYKRFSLKKFLFGLVSVWIILFLFLLVTGSLGYFIQQYFFTIFKYAKNKLTSTGIRDPNSGVKNIIENTNISLIDVTFLLLGGIGCFLYIINKRKIILKEKASSFLIILIVIYSIVLLIDYQSPFDLIIILPALSIFIAWFLNLLVLKWIKIWKIDNSIIFYIILVLFFSVARICSFPKMPDRLSAQKNATNEINELINENEILFLGDLSPLVISSKNSITPSFHFGPKSYLAMNNQGVDLNDFLGEMKMNTPKVIISDQRNLSYDYLSDFYTWIDQNYFFLSFTHNPTLSIYLRNDADGTTIPLLKFLFAHNESFFDEHQIFIENEIIFDTQPVNSHLIYFGYSENENSTFDLYWWTNPPLGYVGKVIYRYIDKNSEPSEWIVFEQIWLSDQITITSLNLPVDINQIEICVVDEVSVLDSCNFDEIILIERNSSD